MAGSDKEINIIEVQAFFTYTPGVHPEAQKVRTRIVDFDSSSDEEEVKKTEDTGWQEDVNSLEQTLGSLGLGDGRRQVREV